MKKEKKTLAQRNNNPGNIVFSKKNFWIGQLGSYKGYCVFDSEYNGFRALVKLLVGYINKGYRSIDDIIYRFCPPGHGGNNPEFYTSYVLEAVSNHIGVQLSRFDKSFFIDLTDVTVRRALLAMVVCISKVEGYCRTITDDELMQIIDNIVYASR